MTALPAVSRRIPAVSLGTAIPLVVVTIYAVAALFAPWVAPYGEAEVVAAPFLPWGGDFLLGTDNLGRDMLSRLIFAARNTIGLVLLTTVLAFLVGVPLEFVAAIAGSWLDQVLSRFADVMFSVPYLIFALLFLAILGNSLTNMVLVIATIEATCVYRIARSIAQNVVAMDFIEAARLRGKSGAWIAWREILPNALPPLLVEFGQRFCYTILFTSSLSFLGLGIQPPAAVWGSMVRDNATLIMFGDITPLLPAAAIGVLTICINALVDRALDHSSHLP